MQARRNIKATRCTHNCQQHLFALKGHPKLAIEKAMCPKHQPKPNRQTQAYPVFNNDRLHFTESFCLGSEKVGIAERRQQLLDEFQEQVTSSIKDKEAVVFPRPSKKHTKCGVCKTRFSHYMRHIMSEDHKEAIQKSTYNGYIVELQENFSKFPGSLSREALPPIQLIRHELSKEQSSKEMQEQPTIEDENAAKSDNTTMTGGLVIKKEIECLVISSSEQEVQVKYDKGNTHSNQEDSESSESQESETKVKKIEEINLESDSDESITITKVISTKPKNHLIKVKQESDGSSSEEEEEDLSIEKIEEFMIKKIGKLPKKQETKEPQSMLIQKCHTNDPNREVNTAKILDGLCEEIGLKKEPLKFVPPYISARPTSVTTTNHQRSRQQIKHKNLIHLPIKETEPQESFSIICKPPPVDLKPILASHSRKRQKRAKRVTFSIQNNEMQPPRAPQVKPVIDLDSIPQPVIPQKLPPQNSPRRVEVPSGVTPTGYRYGMLRPSPTNKFGRFMDQQNRIKEGTFGIKKVVTEADVR